MINNRIDVAPENIGQIFTKYLSDENYLFVFSTDVVMNSWIDWCVTHEEESGVTAVSLDRFIAWDKFKGEYVSSTQKDKTAIPSVLRKIFVQNLIQENAEQLFFKKIINPKYAEDASSFTNWITKMLPSLNLWNKLKTQQGISAQYDEEDEDYKLLYEKYSEFLNQNNFFEPAWIVPDFSRSGKKILIFYPEILEDFADYIDVFEQCSDIILITMPPSEKKHPGCYKYSDSRKELRRTILQIRKLVETQQAQWNEITLSVPDLQTYRPYLQRELTKYCIPFVIRAGFPLTKNCAGTIFKEILECYTSNFSFDSIKSLLLDNYIPWKNEFLVLKENLIKEGQRMRCICSFTEKDQQIDIWEKALSAVKTDYRELQFYSQFKKDITAICKCKTFSAIHDAWMAFKTTYLEELGFSPEADKIISRCITELNNLIRIETNFCIPINLTIDNPYEFFINEIDSKTYTPQNDHVGISVYPYKLSAAAAFKYQFIIDASQENLEIPYKRLAFLNTQKRKALNLTQEDKDFNASSTFINLYAKNADKNIIQFSFAEDSFSGFTIAHTYLDLLTDIYDPLKELDNFDFVENEKKYFLNKLTDKEFKFSDTQKNQFLYWYNINKKDELPEYKASKALQKQIQNVLIENRTKSVKDSDSDSDKGKIVISQSDMRNFFPCPRYWIFSNVLKLKPESFNTSLMQSYDMGNINHEILERYAKYLMNQNKPLPTVNCFGRFEKSLEIEKIIKELADKTIHNPNAEFKDSPLAIQMLETQIDTITDEIVHFLEQFCKTFGGYQIKGVECWYSSSNKNRNFNYTGKIDCLLYAPDSDDSISGWTIIDYKNTKAAFPEAKNVRVDENGELNDFQIPMYVTLIKENEKVKDIQMAAFYAIKTAERQIVFDENNQKKNFETFEPTLQTFEKYAEEFSRCINEQDYTLKSVDSFEDCPKCTFKSICRFNYTVAGRTK